MANSVTNPGIKKLKILFTVVERSKAEFYLDVLSQYEVNEQIVIGGKGTARSEIIDMLGLSNQKAVIVSVIREDMTDTIMKVLDHKFHTIRNGKGIAFTVPMSSVIGVNIYQFLSNNRYMRGNDHDNQ